MAIRTMDKPASHKWTQAEVALRYRQGLTGAVNVETLYYYLGGKLVALKQGGTLSYVAQDHLTGTSLTTDSSGNVVDQIKYAPYGTTRSGDITSTERKFTGQRLDGTGLYFYNARYYDPALGRFISADSVVQIDPRSPSAQLSLTVSHADTSSWGCQLGPGGSFQAAVLDPQLLNRYSYCRNSPLGYVDDSGHWIWTVVGFVVGGAVGFGAYYLSHRDNFSWVQAGYWAASGAIIVGSLGAVAELGSAPIVARGAAAASTAGGTVATKLLNPTNSRQAEQMLSKMLDTAKNTTKFFVQGMTGNRIPDFVNRAEVR